MMVWPIDHESNAAPRVRGMDDLESFLGSPCDSFAIAERVHWFKIALSIFHGYPTCTN